MSELEVESFIHSYRRQENYYRDLAQLAARTIELELEAQGIRAIVTFRPKSTERLRTKLLQRDRTKKYKTPDEIRADVRDLAGVRIALYFPNDLSKVSKLTESLFNVSRIDQLPTNETNPYGRFPGYCATHYTVTLKSEIAGARQNQDDLIEIQIATVFMHAWAEVEHDLRYKPTTGTLSEEELLILEQLNGLALSAEAGLKGLQAAISHRAANQSTSINNHFELAALISRLASKKGYYVTALPMGRADILFYFLEKLNKLSVTDVTMLIETARFDDNVRSLVDPLVDHLLESEPNAAEAFAAARTLTPVNPYESGETQGEKNLGIRFLRLWDFFIKTTMRLLPAETITTLKPKLESLQETLRAHFQVHPIDGWEKLLAAVEGLSDARSYRNAFVHRGRTVSVDALRTESDRLVQAINYVIKLLPTDVGKEVAADLKGLI